MMRWFGSEDVTVLLTSVVPPVQISALEQDIIEVDQDTKEMLKILVRILTHSLAS